MAPDLEAKCYRCGTRLKPHTEGPEDALMKVMSETERAQFGYCSECDLYVAICGKPGVKMG